ncbi:phage replisome organizer N-terminal domain-containing protein [Xanthomonas sacchari]|uniref:phage replisome organizer N-terminal domain-containing protein n=1 Tax=Xanthomonas sacchari TaxID=56458 RepID=UPI002251CB95|nr:phage replisome organizer N-terminal domain-containing protein [Xanthomonas sacchari]MCW0413502.1 hypothetical protein [Xanthomonas sacchari]UYK67795.1 phage replisome organizer N-terminal domain-containing protein [Xanthomonas sacchari]
MAADWIKMRSNLWDDPRVAAIVDATDSSEAAVIGALYWLWAMADQHTEDGYLPGLSLRQIDRKTGVAGFAEALKELGWISVSADGGITIANFTDHNGASAKKRAQTARRVASFKSGNAQSNEFCETGNAPSVTESGNERDLEKEKEKEEDQKLSSSAAPSDVAGDELAQRLAQVTRDALTAYNASSLTKRNGGNLPNVSENVGREKRQQQVRRCLRVAREICKESTGTPLVTPEFWAAYFDLVAQDDFYSGRVRGGAGHENFVPDFETLTAEKTMLRLYDRQVAA